MKQSKICPKCGSTDILRVEGSGGSLETSNILRLGWMDYVDVPRYVCCECGYAEEWVDRKNLFQLREKLEKQRKEK